MLVVGYWVGSGWVQIFPLVVGWVSQLMGWVGSHKMDPRTTLWDLVYFVFVFTYFRSLHVHFIFVSSFCRWRPQTPTEALPLDTAVPPFVSYGKFLPAFLLIMLHPTQWLHRLLIAETTSIHCNLWNYIHLWVSGHRRSRNSLHKSYDYFNWHSDI